MKRHSNFEVRADFAQQLDYIGMDYWRLPSGPNNLPYWQENVMYAFSEPEIDRIQEATQDLHDMSIEMVSRMVRSGDYPEYFALNDTDKTLIEQSWHRGDLSVYGRFDLAMGVDGSLKMFEYNGDTPVSILECSVAQWHKIEQTKTLPNGWMFPDAYRTQYNLIDEHLIEFWQKNFANKTVHFASGAGFRHEDFGNLVYMMDTAYRAGIDVQEIQMDDIGLKEVVVRQSQYEKISFVDLDETEITNCFKLYPWEWMTEEKYGKDIQYTNTRWLEPAWKMLLSNKAMLIKLWEMFPNHPNLLASYAKQPSRGKWAKKAIHGREGSNIYQTHIADGQVISDQLAQGSHKVPEYDQWGYMYQQWFDVQQHDGYYPNFGSWVIGDKACGMSIREDQNVVTGNNAFFASHFFVPEEIMHNSQGIFN